MIEDIKWTLEKNRLTCLSSIALLNFRSNYWGSNPIWSEESFFNLIDKNIKTIFESTDCVQSHPIPSHTHTPFKASPIRIIQNMFNSIKTRIAWLTIVCKEGNENQLNFVGRATNDAKPKFVLPIDAPTDCLVHLFLFSFGLLFNITNHKSAFIEFSN